MQSVKKQMRKKKPNKRTYLLAVRDGGEMGRNVAGHVAGVEQGQRRPGIEFSRACKNNSRSHGGRLCVRFAGADDADVFKPVMFK